MDQRRRRPSARRPRGKNTLGCPQGPHVPAVDGAGTVAAQGEEAGAPAEVDPPTVDQRDPVADPYRCALAGRARTVRVLAAGGTSASILAALQSTADAKGLITVDVSVDSTINRADQHAVGARRNPNGRRNHSVPSHPITPSDASGAAGPPRSISGRAGTQTALARAERWPAR
jgi:hypothetical protein